MIITLLDHSLTYSNNISSIEPCLNKVEDILEENQVYVKLMNVDGVEVYQDFQNYLIENVDNIKRVNIEVQTLQQLVDESLISMQLYLEGALPEVKKLADEFYQGGSKESWDKLNQLFEGLSWITQTLETIQTQQMYHNLSSYTEASVALRDELSNMENALKDADMVLTADILKYEIISILDSLLLTVTTTIDNEVIRNDLS